MNSDRTTWLMPSAFAPHLGGVEELTAQLGRELRDRGHRVLVVTNRWPLDLPARETVNGLDVARVAFTMPTRHPATWLEYLRSTAMIDRTLDALPAPRLIHVQCASTQLSFARRLAQRATVPLIITTQGETMMDAQGLYRRSAWLRRELRRSSVRASALTACSSWTRDTTAVIAPEFTGADVVLNGINPFEWAGLETVPHDPVFGAYGRHVPQKGFDLLIEAFSDVRTSLPTAQLLIGGAGPETARLTRLAGAGVTFLGPLDRAGVRALVERCRVIVVPSRVEPFGIVAVEALAAGRGLVWATHGGLREAAGGLGTPSAPSPTHLAKAMLVEHWTGPDPGAAVHVETLSWSAITDQYEALYENAVQRRV